MNITSIITFIAIGSNFGASIFYITHIFKNQKICKEIISNFEESVSLRNNALEQLKNINKIKDDLLCYCLKCRQLIKLKK